MSDNEENSEQPPEGENDSSEDCVPSYSERVPFYLDPAVADHLVAHQDYTRAPLFDPYWEEDEDSARRRGQRYCKHDVMVREYAIDEYETCESCGRVPALRWFYRCDVDNSGFSHQMEPGHEPVLSPAISNAIDAGHYTPLQTKSVRFQKERVVQVAAADNDMPVPQFETGEVIEGIEQDDEDDYENPQVDFVEDIAQEFLASSATESSIVSLCPPGPRPQCSYRACHHCSSRYQEKAWASLDEVLNDKAVDAPTAWDLRQLSVSDVRVVRTLGTRPAYDPYDSGSPSPVDISVSSHPPSFDSSDDSCPSSVEPSPSVNESCIDTPPSPVQSSPVTQEEWRSSHPPGLDAGSSEEPSQEEGKSSESLGSDLSGPSVEPSRGDGEHKSSQTPDPPASSFVGASHIELESFQPPDLPETSSAGPSQDECKSSGSPDSPATSSSESSQNESQISHPPALPASSSVGASHTELESFQPPDLPESPSSGSSLDEREVFPPSDPDLPESSPARPWYEEWMSYRSYDSDSDASSSDEASEYELESLHCPDHDLPGSSSAWPSPYDYDDDDSKSSYSQDELESFPLDHDAPDNNNDDSDSDSDSKSSYSQDGMDSQSPTPDQSEYIPIYYEGDTFSTTTTTTTSRGDGEASTSEEYYYRRYLPPSAPQSEASSSCDDTPGPIQGFIHRYILAPLAEFFASHCSFVGSIAGLFRRPPPAPSPPPHQFIPDWLTQQAGAAPEDPPDNAQPCVASPPFDPILTITSALEIASTAILNTVPLGLRRRGRG
ncbi:hypothetical protein BO70DRAFT_382661 [Aspergillus heteromorphus CBS 117.55]|uniref:Uncharacterized protein n=1 Tax=Aspergillus heteromorphus CBS 117.55 TaxID=1448321 RepID=A0A317V4C5_9EURO|nr:uncharacterized protein BO70DRAFT_382661 [Aspergillus heteromorphus CBS 117.55]PWY69134.1 hypothetical protein BO70DRAFT_382661 [Aspergillus heteromorphus CBS 117.55]